MDIVKNVLIGAGSGAIPGWITSVPSFMVTKERVTTDLNYMIILAVVGGWTGGLIGGGIGGAFSDKKTAARNGIIIGSLFSPLLSVAIIIDDKINNTSSSIEQRSKNT